MGINWQKPETLPVKGKFLVYLEEPYLRQCHVQVMIRHPNVTFVGGNFGFDCGKILAWAELDETPPSWVTIPEFQGE